MFPRWLRTVHIMETAIMECLLDISKAPRKVGSVLLTRSMEVLLRQSAHKLRRMFIGFHKAQRL